MLSPLFHFGRGGLTIDRSLLRGLKTPGRKYERLSDAQSPFALTFVPL